MATIRARKRADGSYGYTAQVRIHNAKTVVYEEAKTFSRRAAAEKWAKAREVELENPEVLFKAQQGQIHLAALIRWYIQEFRSLTKWRRSKQKNLEFLEKHSIGQKDATTMTSAMIVEHVKSRRAAGAGPSTAMQDLIRIRTVLRAAKSVGNPYSSLRIRRGWLD